MEPESPENGVPTDSTLSSLEDSSTLDASDYSIDFREAVGTGATASIYLAKRCTDDGSVETEPSELVFKVLNMTEEDATSEKDKVASLFQTEVDILADLQKHPNIVTFYGVCRVATFGCDPRWALMMEYCSGGDLVTIIGKHRLTEHQAHPVVHGMLTGLAHMHERGYVHRDVKPENVLLAADGTVKLTDFGISANLSNSKLMEKRCGSPGYVAPEVWKGEKYSIKIDSFSSGAVLYFVISGRLAFSGSCLQSVMQKTLKAPVNFRRSMCLERLSIECKQFMVSLMEKDPENRPTASEAVQAMWKIPEVLLGISPRKSLASCSGDCIEEDNFSEATTRDTSQRIEQDPSRSSSKGACESSYRSSRRSTHSAASEYVGTDNEQNFAGSEWDELGVLCEYQPTAPKKAKPAAASPAVRKYQNKPAPNQSAAFPCTRW